jgi:hypothetical protein
LSIFLEMYIYLYIMWQIYKHKVFWLVFLYIILLYHHIQKSYIFYILIWFFFYLKINAPIINYNLDSISNLFILIYFYYIKSII